MWDQLRIVRAFDMGGGRQGRWVSTGGSEVNNNGNVDIKVTTVDTEESTTGRKLRKQRLPDVEDKKMIVNRMID